MNNVVITNIPIAGEEDNKARRGEYVEITNQGTIAADISGWKLLTVTKQKDFIFPEGTKLSPGQVIRVYSQEVEPEAGGFSFTNEGDNNKGELYNHRGKLVFSCIRHESGAIVNSTPVAIAPDWSKVKTSKLQPRDLQRIDRFGTSVAIDGEWAIVGAYGVNLPGRPNVGAAYLFHFQHGEWQQTQKLQPGELKRGDSFGTSVAIEDSWVIVGALRDDIPGQPNAGAAYVFHCQDGEWRQTQKLQPGDLKRDDSFGRSVAIDGPWAIVGADLADLPGQPNAGAAYVFHCQDGEWKQKQKLQPGDLKRDDLFGGSVAMEDSWAIVGADLADLSDRPNAGAAYVFHYRDGEWKQTQKLQPGDLQRDDLFGTSVGMKDSRAIVGAFRVNMSHQPKVGAAYVFHYEDGEWKQKQKLQPGDLQEADFFGISVAIEGDWAIVGAYGADAPGGPDAGAVYFLGDLQKNRPHP